ncbi:Pex19 protein family-domain-containing protein [Syncephalis fuscata]|nr:Pex19 protein family-domain-containing protein [Syncephalis fuscata]
MSNPAESSDKQKTVDGVTVEDVDDLDDLLDDVLDKFQTPNSAPSATAAGKQQVKDTGKTAAPFSSDNVSHEDETDGLMDDDLFAKELAEGMEELMRQMDNGGDFQKDIEQLLQTMKLDPTAEGLNSTTSSKSQQGTAKEDSKATTTTGGNDGKPQNFQDTITETMNRLKNSSNQAKTESKTAAEDETPDALMAEMMRQMEQLTDSSDFDGIIDGMMNQLMTRDVLYEPMKELAEKYPAYLAENKDKLPDETFKQYEQQHLYVKQIVARFEVVGPSKASNGDEMAPIDTEISKLMQKMQECGQPPKELLEQMAPGMGFDEEGVPNPPDMEQCTIM